MNILYLIDFNCPYSYIGLERIKKAVANQKLDVEWEMKSFELEPLTGKASIGAIDRYAEKFDISSDEALEKIAEIEKIASDDGLKLSFRDMTLRSSKDAHRICKYVQANHPDAMSCLVEKIFHANFVENKNIADNKILKEIAISCGIDEFDANKILDNNYYNIEVELDKDEALIHGITATPCFILTKNEERLIIPGVFSTEEFETALKDFNEGDVQSKSYGFGGLK
ncbi:MAG: DsbA family protein [Methanobrevibacter sp.]|nr:DsbA family protein [Methanobrevibacter sp.]MEE3489749.1 DsbA family protein [Methanobrevibacter sp.]